MVPLLEKNCGGCHDSSISFVGKEDLFKAKKDEIKRRLELPEGDEKRMPLINEQNPDDMDETERLAIILFIDKHMTGS